MKVPQEFYLSENSVLKILIGLALQYFFAKLRSGKKNRSCAVTNWKTLKALIKNAVLFTLFWAA
jgi:hypothetical protein